MQTNMNKNFLTLHADQNLSFLVSESINNNILNNFQHYLTIQKIKLLQDPQTIEDLMSLGLGCVNQCVFNSDKFGLKIKQYETEEPIPPQIDTNVSDYVEKKIVQAKIIDNENNQQKESSIQEEFLTLSPNMTRKSSHFRRTTIKADSIAAVSKKYRLIQAVTESFKCIELKLENNDEDLQTQMIRKRYLIQQTIEQQLKKRIQDKINPKDGYQDLSSNKSSVYSNSEIKPFNPDKNPYLPSQINLSYSFNLPNLSKSSKNLLMKGQIKKESNRTVQQKSLDQEQIKQIAFDSKSQKNKEQESDVIPLALYNPNSDFKVGMGVAFRQREKNLEGEVYKEESKYTLQEYKKIAGIKKYESKDLNSGLLYKQNGQSLTQAKSNAVSQERIDHGYYSNGFRNVYSKNGQRNKRLIVTSKINQSVPNLKNEELQTHTINFLDQTKIDDLIITKDTINISYDNQIQSSTVILKNSNLNNKFSEYTHLSMKQKPLQQNVSRLNLKTINHDKQQHSQSLNNSSSTIYPTINLNNRSSITLKSQKEEKIISNNQKQNNVNDFNYQRFQGAHLQKRVRKNNKDISNNMIKKLISHKRINSRDK